MGGKQCELQHNTINCIQSEVVWEDSYDTAQVQPSSHSIQIYICHLPSFFCFLSLYSLFLSFSCFMKKKKSENPTPQKHACASWNVVKHWQQGHHPSCENVHLLKSWSSSKVCHPLKVNPINLQSTATNPTIFLSQNGFASVEHFSVSNLFEFRHQNILKPLDMASVLTM